MVAYHEVSEYDLLNLDAMESAPAPSAAERDAEEEAMRAIWYAEIDALIARRADLAPRHEVDTYDLVNEWGAAVLRRGMPSRPRLTPPAAP